MRARPGDAPRLAAAAASLAVAAGANVKAAHARPRAAVTFDVYAGLFGDDLDAVADLLDAAAKTAAADRMPTGGARRAFASGEGARHGLRRSASPRGDSSS